MKAQMSFLIKGIYLILILIVIAIVINQITSLNLITAAQIKSLELGSEAGDILEMLTGYERCLAYKELATIEGSEFNLSLHRVIDVNKLEKFADQFTDIQPDCARDFRFGYRARAKTFPLNITTLKIARVGGVYKEVLPLIDGKKVIFVMDVTGSMRGGCGEYEGKPVTKIECVKIFLNNFIDEMSNESQVALLAYSTYYSCPGWGWIFPFTVLDGAARDELKNKVDPLPASGGTPMCNGLEEAFKYGEVNGAEAIVLLTDGCENACNCRCGPPSSTVEVAKNYAYTGIPVHTIGFSAHEDEGYCDTVICVGPLNDTANITGGRYFRAKTCGELISHAEEALNIEIEPKEWEFGDMVFSKSEALREQISVSMPIIVYINSSTFLPGLIEVSLVDGELEQFIGLLEQSCLTERDLSSTLPLSYPVNLEIINNKNHICMQFRDGKECQRLACNKVIEFEGIKSPGNYEIAFQNIDGVLKVIV
ncbi:MAG: VWA domain-containing protein [Candidatus Aenigmarchaeota archaeon]|nr:VWA domain-containing protein [Candidatus Aenigmarchaeota archaeon]